MDSNKSLLEEYGLVEAHKRFKQLCEYTFIGGNELTNEDDEDTTNQEVDPQQGVDDPNAVSDQEQPEGVEGFDPNGEVEDIEMDIDTKQEGDEVIDVDDLTQAQEDTNNKVGELNDKFEKLMNAIDAFDTMIKNNDSKIDDLKAEIEKRNPTQVEKLSMQTQHSYPFNVKPEEYWDETEKTTNYRTEDDENGTEQGQYVITKADVDGSTDWLSIAKSFDEDEDIFEQRLSKYLDL